MRAFSAPAYIAKTTAYSRNMLKNELHLRRNSQVSPDTVLSGFNLGNFKSGMKKMEAQVNFYLYLNAFLPSYSVPESWQIFVQ